MHRLVKVRRFYATFAPDQMLGNAHKDQSLPYPSWLVVAYESLTQQPSHSNDRILQFLNTPFLSSMSRAFPQSRD